MSLSLFTTKTRTSWFTRILSCFYSIVREHKFCNKNNNNSRYLLRPIAVETLGVFNSSTNGLSKEIGLKISANTGESREAFLIPAYFSASVALQRHSVARFFADR